MQHHPNGEEIMCNAKIIYWCQYLYVFYDKNSYRSLDTIVKKYQRIAAIFSNLIGRKVELYDVFVESPLPLSFSTFKSL